METYVRFKELKNHKLITKAELKATGQLINLYKECNSDLLFFYALVIIYPKHNMFELNNTIKEIKTKLHNLKLQLN